MARRQPIAGTGAGWVRSQRGWIDSRSGQVISAGLLTALLLVGACSGFTGETGSAREAKVTPGEGACRSVECRLEALALEASASEGTRREWQTLLAPSFRVFHMQEGLAREVARAAETTRALQLARWHEGSPAASWSPRCEIYLFPSTTLLAQMSGGDRKAGSALARSSQLTRGRTLSRRVNLAADDPGLLIHTLPHEVSHLIVSDLLRGRPVPLWAHEGLAVVEEPSEVHRRYRAVIDQRLSASQTFSVQALMEMTRYPDREYLSLFYAQALSLTQFFLRQRGRSVLIEFLRFLQPGSIEAALRQFYGMSGYLDLQGRWFDFVRGPGT
jgi:hypothetical protein